MLNKKYAEGARRRRTTRALAAACALLLPASAALAQARRAPRSEGFVQRAAARPAAQRSRAAARAFVPEETLLRIVEAEDERRWEDSDLGSLLKVENAAGRRRAARAAGRIGDEGAVAPLSLMLRADADESARAMAAFALGEIEAESGALALEEALARSKSADVRARAVEALGKIAAALPEARRDARPRIGEEITSALAAEGRLPKPNRLFVLLGLTAVLRSKPEGGARVASFFLNSADARVREDAANTLARLRAKESLERLRAMLASDTDPVARANAARALGAAEDAA